MGERTEAVGSILVAPTKSISGGKGCTMSPSCIVAACHGPTIEIVAVLMNRFVFKKRKMDGLHFPFFFFSLSRLFSYFPLDIYPFVFSSIGT